MTETELVEFVVDSVAALDYLRPEALDLRPEMFGGRDGVRFEIATQTAAGLAIRGTALVARVGDRVHVMLYLAPSEHYYDRLLPDVERVFASARFS
ncbi:MAG: hypothetical protein GC206_10680 [Alphaproteobacteria bacterium]|nr:hypothetical protein [Alphaproteobacteria bacterium]